VTPAAVLAGLAVVLATFGAADALSLRRPRTRRRRRRLAAAVTRLGAKVGIAAPKGLEERIAAAGLDVPTREFAATQAGLALIAGLAVLPFVPQAPGRLGPALLVLAPAAGWIAPELRLRRVTRRRTRAIDAELPDVLDLLRVAIAAGLAPPRALQEVGKRHPGTLAREISQAAARRQLGEPAGTSLDRLEQRCPADGIAPLVAALKRAERHGAPLAPTLAAQAAEARSRRAAHRSEQAAKAAPKIQLVVALLLVPAVLLLVAAALAPAL
jgi:tight adherence protein C